MKSSQRKLDAIGSEHEGRTRAQEVPAASSRFPGKVRVKSAPMSVYRARVMIEGFGDDDQRRSLPLQAE